MESFFICGYFADILRIQNPYLKCQFKKNEFYFSPFAIYGIQSRCIISLVFFILKLGKIVIVKEGKLSSKMESFFFLYMLNLGDILT